ncbi:MAG: hypothetical protein R2799_08920 [Crocinitomicaceae bacterium]
MRKLIVFIALIFCSLGYAQRWHFQYGFKIAAGKNFLIGDEKINNGYNFNYQIGFTGRITRKYLIMDMGLLFNYSPYFNSSFMGHKRTNTTGLNIPMTVGLILVNKPLFKWNFQGGIQNSFVFTFGLQAKQSADQLVYNKYQLSGLISTGIEVSCFTLDVFYQPAITRMFQSTKGFNHSVNLAIGLIF